MDLQDLLDWIEHCSVHEINWEQFRDGVSALRNSRHNYRRADKTLDCNALHEAVGG